MQQAQGKKNDKTRHARERVLNILPFCVVASAAHIIYQVLCKLSLGVKARFMNTNPFTKYLCLSWSGKWELSGTNFSADIVCGLPYFLVCSYCGINGLIVKKPVDV